MSKPNGEMMSLGVEQMPSKSAADTMDALKFILNRIDNASS